MKIKRIELDAEKYPMMAKFAHEITPFTAKLVGNDDVIEAIFATYEDSVVFNAVLLAPPGTGKTTLMKGLAYQDKKTHFGDKTYSDTINRLIKERMIVDEN